jgi:type IV pilus assembly protein PilY1
MRKKILFGISIVSMFLIASSVCYALDTDLYVLSGVNIPPNVVIIADSSASMNDVVQDLPDYDPNTNYSTFGPATVYPANEVYWSSGKINASYADTTYTTSTMPCPDLVNNYLVPYGMASNYTGCGYKNLYFQTGNYMNYLQLGGQGSNRPRLGIQNGILHSYINTTSGVRFTVMTFNKDKDGNVVVWDGSKKIEKVYGDDRDLPLDAAGGKLLGFVDENKNGRTDLFSALDGIKQGDTWSPLAETLYETGAYLSGKRSVITGADYTSPLQYYCQKNYVLVISDGDPTKDSDPRLSSVPGMTDLNGNGKIDMDEVSKYLYNMDLSDGTSPSRQNIKTYTISFNPTNQLMMDTATKGGGKYYYVWSSQSFSVAFQNFIAEVLQESVSYVAPVVPISQMERTSAGNQLYLAMFKPTTTSFWKGNIKKYCLATRNSSGEIVDCNNHPVSNVKVGDILDVNGAPVLTTSNDPDCESCTVIEDTAQSYWSSGADGGNTDMGGVGEVLQNRTDARKIYTYFGTNVDLTNSSNAFTTSNGTITPSTLGLASGDTTGKNNVINFIHGYDVYYQNELPPQGPTAKRNWILGAFIHSRPAVIHYDTVSVIYAGANDGMIHAFNDATGEELWSFIPPDLLPNLKNLNGEALQFFVDGPPKAYIERDSSNNIVSATLIFGERRGGNHYYALDVTLPYTPKFLWSISPSEIVLGTTKTATTAYGEMGQTWSAPQLGKVSGGQWVAFISGGYDDLKEDLVPPGADTKGRAIYVVNISNGSPLWSYSHANNANMKYSIPSDIARVDTNGDGYIDRLYIGDVGGQMWRFDLGGSGLTGKILFDSQGIKRKIFYPPDVTLEQNYEMIFFGTGDREHPKDTTKVDRIYAIKDKNPSSPLTESSLVDVTQDLLQVGTDSQKTDTMNALQTQSGWFIQLDQNVGEKCLSTSVLFAGTIYYTTFTPIFGDPNDPCFLSQGDARIYALNYKTGDAVFNLDAVGMSTDLTRDDRSAKIGVSIPSGVIITFIGGTTVAYGGVGGGVYRPPVSSTRTVFPVNWRIIF